MRELISLFLTALKLLFTNGLFHNSRRIYLQIIITLLAITGVVVLIGWATQSLMLGAIIGGLLGGFSSPFICRGVRFR